MLTCIVEVLSEHWEPSHGADHRGKYVIMEWNGSIVTAEVVCVARVWRKFDRFGNPKPETRVEWGGEDFGQTEISKYGPKTVGGFHTQKQKYCCFCPDLGVVYAIGPADGIAYGVDVTTKRQDLINLGLWFSPCIVGIVIACLASFYHPQEFNIKNRAGENVGCITGEYFGYGVDHTKPIVMHFRGMTLEQRRLGLVAALHDSSGRNAGSWRE